MENKLIDLCKLLLGDRNMIKKSYLDGEYEIDIRVKRVNDNDYDEFLIWLDCLPMDIRDEAVLMSISEGVYKANDINRKDIINNIKDKINNLLS